MEGSSNCENCSYDYDYVESLIADIIAKEQALVRVTAERDRYRAALERIADDAYAEQGYVYHRMAKDALKAEKPTTCEGDMCRDSSGQQTADRIADWLNDYAKRMGLDDRDPQYLLSRRWAYEVEKRIRNGEYGQ